MNTVLYRIREIQTRFSPETATPEEGRRFTDVMREVQREEASREDLPEVSEGTPEAGGGDRGEPLPGSLSERLARWESILREKCGQYGVDPNLARAVMQCESGGNERVVSRAGAIGLMQLMPGTARALGVDPWDPSRNIEGGVKYLAQMTERYDGDLERALAAYNAGAARVDASGGIPSIPETQRYVRNVMALYRRFSGGE
jgi:soluble lytic murein transglycosylase-like protein